MGARPARTARPTTKPKAPLFGPEKRRLAQERRAETDRRQAAAEQARREREAELDRAAIGSLAARHGTFPDVAARPRPRPAPKLAPAAPPPPPPPSAAEERWRLTKALARASAPARRLLREQARARAEAEAAAEREAREAEHRARRAEAEAEAEREARERAAVAAAAAAAEARAQAERESAAVARASAVAAEPTGEGWIGGPAPITVEIVGRAPPVAAPPPRLPDPTPVPRPARVDPPVATTPTTPARPGPPAPTPIAKPKLQAPVGRGRVDPTSLHGALLLMAPPPGGRAARCFAELLDRHAGRRSAADHVDPLDSEPSDRGVSHRREEDMQALACLYRHADGFYRTLDVPPGDGPPLNGDRMRASILPIGGSLSSQLVEG